jgi:hypothetical protein
MKILRIVSVVLAMASGVSFADTPKGSDSGGSVGSGSGGTVSDADAKRWLAFWDKLVDTVIADKDNCPKMGTDLNALIDANKDLVATAQKAQAGGKQLPPDALQHMKDAAPKMATAAMNCAKDPNVKGALQRLNFKRNQ